MFNFWHFELLLDFPHLLWPLVEGLSKCERIDFIHCVVFPHLNELDCLEFCLHSLVSVGGVAQLVWWLATDWTVRGSNPGGGEIFHTGPGAHPASCTMGTGSFPGVKSGRGVTLAPHPLLVPWSWKGRAIPLLPLWAVRPVQGCTLPFLLTTSDSFFGRKWWPSKWLHSLVLQTDSVILLSFKALRVFHFVYAIFWAFRDY